MIKKNQQYINIIMVLLDIISITAAYLLSWYFRFLTPIFGTAVHSVPFPIYISTLWVIIPVYLILFKFLGLYDPHRKKSLQTEIRGIVVANVIGFLIVIAWLFTQRQVDYSRYALLLFILFCIFLLSYERTFIRLFLRNIRRKGYNLKHLIIIGAGENGRQFVKRVKENTYLGYNICGFIDDYTTGENGYILGEKVLGTTKDLTSILSECEVDEIIIALANSQYEKINRLIDECEYHGVKTQIIPDYFHIIPAKPFFDELDDIPLITTRYVPLDDGMNSFLKRLFDIIISAMILIFLSPLLLVIAIGVRVSSPGPIIYRQKRIGLHRKEFEIYKFRSMRVNDGGWTTKEDPRKTKFGAFIRRTSIDELPQFVNVLKGDMSIIGPRPEQPKYVWEFKEEIPKYMIKHHVRPGITGWAQVNGWRGDTSIKERIKCDVEYIEKWSIWFDVKIFFMTFKAMFKNAY